MNILGSKIENNKNVEEKESPTRAEAEEAVRTLIKWAGDDPKREGLLETPKRVVSAFEEWFVGYLQDPEIFLQKTFNEVENYSDPVLLKDIPFESYCEHHLAPIIGKAHISYIPNNKVVGISKLARLVDAFAKRMQVQEKLTYQIGKSLQNVLNPSGVAVLLEGEHHCMCTRGVHKSGISMITTCFLGKYEKDRYIRDEFLVGINKK